MSRVLSYSNNMVMFGGTSLYFSPNYNPLNLPAYTIRLKFEDGVTPTTRWGTLTQVSSSPNVWDLTYQNSNWSTLCCNAIYNSGFNRLTEVLGANTAGVTNMSEMFIWDTALTYVAPFDTSAVTDFHTMFGGCSALTVAPLIDTGSATDVSAMFSGCTITSSPVYDTQLVTNFREMFFNCTNLTSLPQLDVRSATNVGSMFENCRNAESGILDMYNKLSARSWSSSDNYYNCFDTCGSDTVTGAAELAQIPAAWK